MTIRHWDATCNIIGLNPKNGSTTVLATLLSTYGDGSGKIGKIINVNINQLNADGGWSEISESIEKLIHKDRKEQVMSELEKSYNAKSLKELAEIYNSLVPKNKQVKRFADKASAIKRMTEAFKNPITPPPIIKEQEKKMTKETAPSETKQLKLVGRKSGHAGKKIYKIVQDNPRRAASHGAKNWEIYKDGMTYEQYILNKGGANHLNYDLEKGFIELR